MALPSQRSVHTSVDLNAKFVSWKSRTKYTVKPVKMRKSGGRDHTGGRKGGSALGSWVCIVVPYSL